MNWTLRYLASLVVPFLIACGPSSPKGKTSPAQPETTEVGPLYTCDMFYEPVLLEWDELVEPFGFRPADKVAELEEIRTEVFYDQAQTEAHPWVQEARVWRFELAPHPTRPPVYLPAAAHCPEMAVLPVAVRATLGGGLVVIEDSGESDRPGRRT